MKVKLQLLVDENVSKEHVLEIPDHKLEELTEEETEAAIQILVRDWVNETVGVAWEVLEEDGESE
ncbi:DUF7167 family protein [Paenibacillus turpanensis]|uniref:DUF7167 family protein n=1 Tax=Paenibacillus turpanensis TaxID=2689078 RepID=UPI003C7ABAB3